MCRTSAEKFVLIMLCNHADEQFTCYPGVKVLAHETQLGESTVRRCLTNLVADKKIRVLQRWGRRGSRRSNRYQVLVHGPEMELPEAGDWHHEYAYTPRPKPDEADDDGTDQDTDGKPLDPSDMPDQGVQTAQSERFEQTAQSERYEPLDPGGLNLPIREVSNKEESSVVDPQEESFPPTPQPEPTASEPDGAVTEGEDSSKEKNNLHDLLLDAAIEKALELKPKWKPRSVRATVYTAVQDGRHPEDVAAAIVVAAADATTLVPSRILNEIWWNTNITERDASVPLIPCLKPGHQSHRANNCGACKANKFAGDCEETYRGQPAQQDAERAAEPGSA